ncbi:MAG: reverse transcriptase family protein [Isosphaeraceae bacterium]
MTRKQARALAAGLVVGPWTEEDLAVRIARALGKSRPRFRARSLARRLIRALGDGTRPARSIVEAFLFEDGPLRRAWESIPAIRPEPVPDSPVMWPSSGPPSAWESPALVGTAELAGLLGLSPAELEWFADVQGRNRRSPDGPLRHYRVLWRRKRSGEVRVIEVPKARLKAIQRRLLDEIVARIPPHDAAHGFRPGRSVRSFASPHVGRPIVLKLDLRDFFPSVSRARIQALFRTAGYPEPVALALAGLCTSRVPNDAWDDPNCPSRGGSTELWRLRKRFALPHLPQGAPTSPALANLAAFRLDARLTGLARSAGAIHTRYADDLAFSGDGEFARKAARFVDHVGAVALEEGFEVNPRKTRAMRRGVRQRLAGLVVNDRLNLPRDEFDRLKATLHNCLKTGPMAQNRGQHADFRAHLMGRVAHLATVHLDRGKKLAAILARIDWEVVES